MEEDEEIKEEIKPGFIRVSTIIKPLSDFSGIDPYIVDNKKMLGVRVHKAIDEYILTRSTFTYLQEQDRGYFESWKKWFEDDEFSGKHKDIFNNEVRLYDDKRMITGKIDGVWKNDGKIALVDWKTSYNENELVWPTQAALYMQLIKKNKLCDCSNTAAYIKLDKNGEYPKVCVYEISRYHLKMADWFVKEYFRKLATGYN